MTSTFQPDPQGPFSTQNALANVGLEKRPAAKPAVKAQPKPARGAPFKPTPAPATPPAPKLEPPNPVLQAHGFNGGIQQFNQRVQQAHDAYRKAYGSPPPPNTIFDLALSKVPGTEFGKMFTVPLNPAAAKARAVLKQAGRIPASTTGDPVLTVRDVTVGMIDAAARGTYDDFLRQHADVIADMQKNPATASMVNGAIRQAKLVDEHRREVGQPGQGSNQPGLPSDLGNPNNLVAPSDRKIYEEAAAAGFEGIGHYVVRGTAQVADALVHSPAGLYQVGKAAGLDTNDALERGVGLLPLVGTEHERQHSASFTRTRTIAKATAKGTLQDVEHPDQNPGYLFLDALGLASAGAGTAARVGAASRAVGELGEEASAAAKVGTAAKTLARKPPLQRATVNYRGYAEEMPLSQNPLVAAAQKGILKVREKGAVEGHGPLASFLLPNFLQTALEEQLSIPKKLGRLADTRKRVEFTAQTTLQRELDAVAGRKVFQARVLSRTPAKIRGGLSRGEQKAIQVLATDDLDPLTTERQFHQSMIEQNIGDVKAHRRQIADLKLAQKVLENPSSRFLKALELTRRVAAEQERIKIQDLGLLPETAEGRVAKLGAFYRGEVVPLERVNDESFYLPVQPRGKIKRPPSSRPGYYPTKAGPFGIPVGRVLPELSHEFTGKAIRAGDYRIDATSLASEGYGRTVRAATVRAEHAKLWQAASDTPQSRFDIPIRDSNTIPDKLRTIIARIDEGDFSQADAELLPSDMADLIQELYPHPDKLIGEDGTPIEGVKWVDARLLGEGNLPPQVEGAQARIGDLINEPFRFLSLYVRPAYILNKLGNEGMLAFDQGVFTSAKNILRAMNGNDLYGEENMRTIRELVGAGHARNLVTSKSSRVGQAVARFWNVVADRDERVAAFIYYANRLGYTSKDDFTRLLNAKESRADLVEATSRANKSLVEFDNLLPFEKNVLRHWVFVYPWVSRSAVWSIRALLEHPIKTDLLAQLGREDIQDDPLNGKVVEWVKRAGYVPLGWDHNGNPKVVNPSSVNTFSTIGDFLAVTRAATEGDKYASAEDFLGPFPKYMVHAITGRDEFGNKYPGSQWWDAAKEVMQGLPQVAAYQKGGNDKTAGKTANVGSRSSIVASFNAALKQTVLSPGWLDGYGSLLVGGLSPRSVNMNAAAARYWNDQDPQVKHRRELDLLNRALDVQADVLKTTVPSAVRTAVKDQANITFASQQFQKAHGRAPTDKERASLTLGYLTKQGVIPAAQRAKLAKTLNGLVDPHDIAVFKTALITKYGHGKQLRQWDTDIRTVASFTPEVFNAKVAKLYQQGLAPQKRYQVGQDKLYDYGRKYVQFTHQVAKIQQDIQDGTKTMADLTAFQDAHDVPVDGLPSFVRVAWTHNTPQEQQQHIAAITTQSWGGLSVFDKQLLGVKSTAKVTAGWAKLKDVVAEQRTKLERAGESYPAGYTRILARWVEKNFDAPGLVRDYDFSKEPLYRRMQVMKPITSSPNADLWSKLFVVANDYHRYLNTDGYNKTQVRQMWRDYVNSPGFQQWIDQNPSFKAEIAGYGKGLLGRLIG